MFRLLSLGTGPRVSVAAAASLAGTDHRKTRIVLGSLRRAHMIMPTGHRDWFRLHDLIRLFAIDRSRSDDDQRARDEAIAGLLDYFLETTSAANNQLLPAFLQKPAMRRFTARRDALAWLDAERLSLTAAVRLAYDIEQYEDARDLAHLLSAYLDLRRYWDDWRQI
jgi:hypothetical protein